LFVELKLLKGAKMLTLEQEIKWRRRKHLIKRILGVAVILYFFIAIMFFALDCHAGVFDVQVYQSIATDTENIVQNGRGAKIRAFLGDAYVYVQKEDTTVRFSGQGGAEVKFFSLGVGVRLRIKPDLYVSFDGGWYEPKSTKSDQVFPDTCLSEGLYYYLNNYLGMTRLWDYYTLQYQGSIGCSVNLDYSYAISKRWNVGLSVGYRYLNFNEKIKGKDFGDIIGWWEIKQPRSFGAGLIALTITYEF